MPPIKRHSHWLFSIESAVPDPAVIVAALAKVATHGRVYSLPNHRVKGYCFFTAHRFIPTKRPWWSHRTTWLASNSLEYMHYFDDIQDIKPIFFGVDSEEVYSYKPPASPSAILLADKYHRHFDEISIPKPTPMFKPPHESYNWDHIHTGLTSEELDAAVDALPFIERQLFVQCINKTLKK